KLRSSTSRSEIVGSVMRHPPVVHRSVASLPGPTDPPRRSPQGHCTDADGHGGVGTRNGPMAVASRRQPTRTGSPRTRAPLARRFQLRYLLAIALFAVMLIVRFTATAQAFTTVDERS